MTPGLGFITDSPLRAVPTGLAKQCPLGGAEIPQILAGSAIGVLWIGESGYLSRSSCEAVFHCTRFTAAASLHHHNKFCPV